MHHHARRLLLGVAAAIAAVTAVGASHAEGAEGGGSTAISPPAVFAKQIEALQRRTAVPILLPGRIPGPAGRRLYPSARAARGGWALHLAGAPRCGSATACFLASFEARRGGRLPRNADLRLAGGQPAVYAPIVCGASCSPATLWFAHRGVLHRWRLKEPPPGGARGLARLAAGAIAAGPR